MVVAKENYGTTDEDLEPCIEFPSISKSEHAALGESMTLDGTVNKTGILLVCAGASAAWAGRIFMQTRSVSVLPLMWIGLLGGLVFAMITIFK